MVSVPVRFLLGLLIAFPFFGQSVGSGVTKSSGWTDNGTTVTALTGRIVGIGTASPLALLHTQGITATTSATGTVTVGSTGNITGVGTLFGTQVNLGDEVWSNTTLNGVLNSVTSATVANMGNSQFSMAGGSAFFYVQPSLKALSSDNTRGVIVARSGNVNIGSVTNGFQSGVLTVNDAATNVNFRNMASLDVVSAGSSNGAYAAAVQTSGGMLLVSNAGGIYLGPQAQNTTGPLGKLHAGYDASSTTGVNNVNVTVPVLLLGSTALASASANGTYFGVNSQSSFTGNFINLQNNGVDRMVFTGAGNLGLGITTPVYLLDVAKSGASGTARFFDQTATTGATLVTITPGAAQTAASTVLSLGGVAKFGGTNTTAAVAGVIGNTCPAVTCTAAFTWVQAVSSDGSTVYFPVWK